MKNYCRLGLFVIAFVLPIILAGCGGGSPAPVTTELSYDNSIDADISAYGAIAAPNQECCVIFDAAKLASYMGGQIIAVKLFNPDTISHDYTPQIFTADAGINPPTPASINSTAASISSKSWQTITLDTPVTIQTAKVYWAGYKTPVTVSDHPLAVGAESDYSNNRQRNSGIPAGLFGVVAYNWIVKILVRK
jgi:hypothetical protein